jgi:hypothetical protein
LDCKQAVGHGSEKLTYYAQMESATTEGRARDHACVQHSKDTQGEVQFDSLVITTSELSAATLTSLIHLCGEKDVYQEISSDY